MTTQAEAHAVRVKLAENPTYANSGRVYGFGVAHDQDGFYVEVYAALQGPVRVPLRMDGVRVRVKRVPKMEVGG